MVPPLAGVAVKVTLLPLHIVVCVALILTVGVTGAVTASVRLLLLTVAGEAHCASLVSAQVITSPLAGVLSLKLEVTAPAMLLPFRFHW